MGETVQRRYFFSIEVSGGSSSVILGPEADPFGSGKDSKKLLRTDLRVDFITRLVGFDGPFSGGPLGGGFYSFGSQQARGFYAGWHQEAYKGFIDLTANFSHADSYYT